MAGAAAGHAGATDADLDRRGDLGRWAKADAPEDHDTTQADRAQGDPEDDRKKGDHQAQDDGSEGDHQAQDDGSKDSGPQADRAQGHPQDRAEDDQEGDPEEAPLAGERDRRRPPGRR